MKLKEGFITHETGEEQIMVGTGEVRFAGLVRSNKTAAFIIDCLKVETTREEIVSKMVDCYDASREVIAADVQHILEQLDSIGAIVE